MTRRDREKGRTSGSVREGSQTGPEWSFGDEEVKVIRGKVKEQPSCASRSLGPKTKPGASAGVRKLARGKRIWENDGRCEKGRLRPDYESS